jgi:hypothetical protein
MPGVDAQAARRNAAAAITWTRSATWSRKASSGGRCPRTCRAGAPSVTWPTAGTRAGRPRRCTMSCAASAASRPGASPSPRPRSSTPSRWAAEEVSRPSRIVYWAMTITMTRRLARGPALSRPAPRARQALRWSRPALNGGLLSLRVARIPVQARDGAVNDHFQELGVDLFP